LVIEKEVNEIAGVAQWSTGFFVRSTSDVWHIRTKYKNKIRD